MSSLESGLECEVKSPRRWTFPGSVIRLLYATAVAPKASVQLQALNLIETTIAHRSVKGFLGSIDRSNCDANKGIWTGRSGLIVMGQSVGGEWAVLLRLSIRSSMVRDWL